MSDSIKPRTFAQASVKRHHRHGKQYDPDAAKKESNTAAMVFVVIGFLVLCGAGAFFAMKWHEKSEAERIAAEAPLRSKALLEEMRKFRREHAGDDQIDAVRIYVEQRKGDLMDAEAYEAEQLLVALKEQKVQAGYRKRLDDKLNFVRANAGKPDQVENVKYATEELEKLLIQMDDTRAADVKNEIFIARGKSSVAAARMRLQQADKLAQEKPTEFEAVVAAYEKADEVLAESAVAQKLPETKEIRDEVALKVNALAERWAESPKGFSALPLHNLLDGKEFETQKGDEKPHWQASPTAKLSWNGNKLVIEGVKPEHSEFKDPRAGIAFWSPNSKTAIRHYELRLRVKIVKRGFQLSARQGSGYARHLYQFEDTPADEKRDPEGYYPKEGESYDIVQRVYGKKVNIQVTPLSGEEVLPAPTNDSISTLEGGIGLQVRVGAKIEIERLEIRVLH